MLTGRDRDFSRLVTPTQLRTSAHKCTRLLQSVSRGGAAVHANLLDFEIELIETSNDTEVRAFRSAEPSVD